MGYLLIILKDLLSGTSTVLNKNYVRDTGGIRSALHIYLLGAHLTAAIFLFLLAKGSVPLNELTFLFAAVFGINCGFSAFVNMVSFEKTSLVYRAVFSGAGAVMVPFLFELVRGERFAAGEILSVLLRMAAIAVPLLFSREKFRGLMVCLLLFLFGGTGTVITKLFSQNSGVTSESSFCFWTNVLILPAMVFIAVRKCGFANLKRDAVKIRPKQYVYIVAQTVLNNVVSLMGIFILRLVSATTYSVLSSSIALLITTAISVLLYKEKLSKPALLSMVLSVVSILVSAI